MKKLYVYADFDWLDTPQLIGELSFDSVRRSETYGFSYNKEWLAKYGDVFLSEDLQNFPGIQYSRPERDIFACFSDALPDRWGRTLLNRREQLAAAEEKRPVRRLSSFDYLMGIDDESRMGGFRFAETPGGEFINCEASLRVPPLASVRELMQQAIKAICDEEKALADLIPDAHGWHKSFSLSELNEAHAKIQATLDYWKAKGYDLATDSNLSVLKTELEQKIKFVENPGAFKAGLKAHKTWPVQQDSYIKLLDKVETRIETIKLEADYNTLLAFKTTSKDFANYMAEAKAALDAGDPATAKHFINEADWKKRSLEAKRKGRKGAATASDTIYDGFDVEQLAKAQELEKKVMDLIEKCQWSRTDLYTLSMQCDEYMTHILNVSEGLFGSQKSIFSAAEQKAYAKTLKEYLSEKGINPNYIWGAKIGGVYDSMEYARENLSKMLLGKVSADELSLITRFSSGMTFYNAYNLRNSSPYFRQIWRDKLRKLAGRNGKVKLKDIRDQYRIIEEYTQGLNSIQDRMMRYRGVTFRAVHSEGGKELLQQFEDCWKNKKAWRNNAAASTSTDIQVSVSSFDDRGHYDVIMVIRNKTGCHIRPISEYDYEKEVMIIKNQKYRVLKKPREINGKYVVELEEI